MIEELKQQILREENGGEEIGHVSSRKRATVSGVRNSRIGNGDKYGVSVSSCFHDGMQRFDDRASFSMGISLQKMMHISRHLPLPLFFVVLRTEGRYSSQLRPLGVLPVLCGMIIFSRAPLLPTFQNVRFRRYNLFS